MINRLEMCVDKAMMSMDKTGEDVIYIKNIPEEDIVGDSLKFTEKVPFKDNYMVFLNNGSIDYNSNLVTEPTYTLVVKKIRREDC